MNNPSPLPAPQRCFALIIGSGFAGLDMAIALRKAAIADFVILEKADQVGGTWRENVYPGCACDVPSHVYSYSYEPNPRWSATYSPQPEIRAYIERCVTKYDVRRHIVFGEEAIRAAFDEERGIWVVTTRSGKTFESRVLAAGLGPLGRPKLPDIPGLDRFRGPKLHSAKWDVSFDPKGRTIASIGTGASAIQFVPELAKTAAKLHVFQRTAPWVLPRKERAYSDLEKAIFASVPGAQRLFREAVFWSLEARALALVNRPAVLRLVEKIAIGHMHKAISDPALRKKLTPSYRLGCKRILLSNTYYPALARPNVEVITERVREVTEDAVITEDGAPRSVDSLILGTGFDVHDYTGSFTCAGRGGADLRSLWSATGAQAYKGTLVSGFPNFFVLFGPNTALGHNSMIYMIESQVRHAMKLVLEIHRAPGLCIDVDPAAQTAYNEALQAKLARTVWASGCSSWYLDDHGRNTTLWPGFCFQFRRTTDTFDPAAYVRTFAPSP